MILASAAAPPGQAQPTLVDLVFTIYSLFPLELVPNTISFLL